MKRTAIELRGLSVTAKSEAVMHIQRHDNDATIQIDKRNGQPDVSASVAPINRISFKKESGKALTMQMHWMGRCYECGVEGQWYEAEEG